MNVLTQSSLLEDLKCIANKTNEGAHHIDERSSISLPELPWKKKLEEMFKNANATVNGSSSPSALVHICDRNEPSSQYGRSQSERDTRFCTDNAPSREVLCQFTFFFQFL